jgi:hypothetical protein
LAKASTSGSETPSALPTSRIALRLRQQITTAAMAARSRPYLP